MARKPRPVRTPATITAGATRINLADGRRAAQQAARRQEWQHESWAYAEEVPEIGFGLDFLGNAFSKLRVYAGVRPAGTDPDSIPVPVESDESDLPPELAASAVAEIARLSTGMSGMPGLLRRANMNLEVPGEFYLLGLAATTDRQEEWTVRSTDEIHVGQDGAYHLLIGPGDRPTNVNQLTDADTVIRMWQEHPRWQHQPWSAMRRLNGECRILQVLSQLVLAQSMRSVSAGFMTWPNQLSVGAANPATPEQVEQGTEPEDPLSAMIAAILTGPIDDPSDPASVQPGLIRGEAEWLKPEYLRIIRTWDPQADDSLDRRIEARVTRIARGINLPVEVLQGHMQTTFANACVDDETEILTREGWQRQATLRVGDEVLTLDHRTGCSEWQSVEHVHRYEVVDEPMLLMDGRAHSSLTTGNHRWPILIAQTEPTPRRWQVSETLNTNHRIITGAPNINIPSEPKWTDEFVELVAWHWTEGHVHRGTGKPGVTTITQSGSANPEHCERIRAMLHRLLGPARPNLLGVHAQAPNWSERRDRDRDIRRFRLSTPVTRQLEHVAPYKRPTAEFILSLTRAQLDLFIDVSLLADGWRTNMDSRVISQSDPAGLAGMELACILTGRTPRRWTGNAPKAYPTRPPHYLAVSERVVAGVAPQKSQDPAHATREWVEYTGTVWCPTTRNGTWFARRNGTVYFTGNSQVDADTFEDFLHPRCVMLAQLFTHGFLLPNLRDSHPGVADVERVVVWYDASAIIAQPDREKNAVAAHDRFLISDRAGRAAMGWDEDDAPSTEEILTRAALNQTRLGPQIAAALLQPIGQETPGVDVPQPDQVGPGSTSTTASGLAGLLAAAQRNRLALPASARPVRATAGRGVGWELSDIDRDLRTRLVAASNAAMNRALERAGSRLRSAAVNHRAVLRNVPAVSVGATIGRDTARSVLAAGNGGTPEDAALAGAWDDLERDFLAWAAAAGVGAVALARTVVAISDADAVVIGARQAADVADAWAWMRSALTDLAAQRMFDPDPAAPALGEFDASLRVPPSLIRQAMARAGGASGLITDGRGGAFVAVADSGARAAGGVATGDLIMGALTDRGASIEGYEWDYGPAYRQRPFEPHEALSGVTFANFDDPVLTNFTGWPGDYCMPGDHDGCVCSAVPVLIAPADQAAA